MSTPASAEGERASAPVPFRRLYGLARPYLGPLLAGTVLLLAGTGVFLVVPMRAGQFVDTALDSGSEQSLGELVSLLIGLFAVLGVLGYFQAWLLGAAGARLLRDLRRRLFGHLIGLSIDFFDRRRVGELLSRMNSDLTVVQTALTEQIPSGLQAVARFVGVLAILLVLHTRLTAVALLVVPPVVVFAMVIGRRLERVAVEERDAVAETSAWAEEALAGVRTLQAFSAEDQARGRYRERLVDLLAVQLRNVRLYGAFSGLMTFLGFSAFALVLGYGGNLMLGGALTPGQLTSFLLYTFAIATSVGQLGSLYAGYRRLRGSSERVFQLLDEGSAIVDSPSPVRLPEGASALSIRSVAFRYEGTEQPAIADVSMDVAPGELAALVGPSGSGKSTLFALLLRFYEPQQGELLLEGRPLADLALSDLRRRIALVPQDIFLFSGSVADNIRLARPGADDADVRAAAEAAGAVSFIERLDEGFATGVGERGVRLSAGQRQRIAIARAFLRDPQILLLDEATSALDPDSEATVQRAIEQLLEGRTTIVIAHRLATARRARRIHVLDQGRLVAGGSHEELYETNELYRRYWLLQSLESQQPPAASRFATGG
ncbi:MAG: ABC transporter transmembrane domain-containing protein [Acidobacteria bacterium]|nr:ABC transporter transmembrane domain-containing protein [Acidobacteriota bacterium]